MVYLSLGSNTGDRRRYIETALAELETALGVPPARVSAIIETPSWGFDAPPFLNCAAAFGWPGEDPFRLLDICKEIERKLGRTDGPEYDKSGRRIYHSRTIDIDILFFDSLRLDTPRLTIPHKLISKRDFVKIPLAEIADDEIRGQFPDIFETI